MTRRGRRRASLAVLIAALGLGGACDRPAGGLSALEPPPVLSTRPGETYLALGTRLLAAREPVLAQKAFTASMRREGVTAEAMTGAGIAVQQQGLVTEARRYFEQARALAPDSVTANNNLGVVLYMLEEYHAARDAFRAAYALSSGTSEMAERNLNHTEELIAQIEDAGAPEPAISHRLVRLGSSEFRLIPTDAAEAAAEH